MWNQLKTIQAMYPKQTQISVVTMHAERHLMSCPFIENFFSMCRFADSDQRNLLQVRIVIILVRFTFCGSNLLNRGTRRQDAEILAVNFVKVDASARSSK